jgi:hypothetical protein
MNKKFISRQNEQELQEALQQSQKQSPVEFSNVEEMLRHDTLQTPVPPGIAHRLQESLGRPARQNKSWWKRLLGG